MNEIESVAPDLNGLTFLRQKLIKRSARDHFSIGFGVPEAVFRHIKTSFSAPPGSMFRANFPVNHRQAKR
jgi:hypothetical protein